MKNKRSCDYTEEQEKWAMCNLTGWKNQQEFVDAFNKEFGTSKTLGAINRWLSKRKIKVQTYRNSTVFYSLEQDKWLCNNFSKYDDYVSLTIAYNRAFGTDKTNGAIRRHCVGTLKLNEGCEYVVRGKRKFTKTNTGMYEEGRIGNKALPIGTIRFNNDGRPFIKVKECNGEAGAKEGKGHNYQEPFWKPLQKKIWEEHHGEVPKGYVVCSLNGNPCDTDIKNIGIIKKSATALMAKNGWWSEEKGITETGIKWCELHEVLKKNNVKERKIER